MDFNFRLVIDLFLINATNIFMELGDKVGDHFELGDSTVFVFE